jgi:hypothetical protein
VTRKLVTDISNDIAADAGGFSFARSLDACFSTKRSTHPMKDSSPVIKYGITDGEQVGWFDEADTLKRAAALIRNAKEFVIAIENGKPRQLTADENAELERCRRERGF